MLLGSDILRLFFTGPYLASSPLCSVSGVDCPSILPRQLLFCSVSGVDCPSVDPRQLPLLLSNYQLFSWSPAINCLSWAPATNCSLLSCHQLLLPLSGPCLSLVLASLWSASSTLVRVPLPLPDTARFQVQESFVWFRAKTDNWIVCFGSLPP